MKKNKNKILLAVGVLLILVSFYSAVMSGIISAFHLKGQVIWVFLLSGFTWITTLLALKKMLNDKYEYKKSDMLLWLFLTFIICSFILKTFYPRILIHELLELFAFLIMIVTPFTAMIFYISVLRVKNTWIRILGIMGFLLAISEIGQLGISFLLVNIKNYRQYLGSYIMGNMVGGVLVGYAKLVRNVLLGSLFVLSGTSRK